MLVRRPARMLCEMGQPKIMRAAGTITGLLRIDRFLLEEERDGQGGGDAGGGRGRGRGGGGGRVLL